MSFEVFKLGDISNISTGQSAPQDANAFSEAGTPFIRAGSLEKLINGLDESDLELINNENAKKYKLKLFPKDTIVFAKSGMSATLGRVYQLKNPCFVVSHLATVIPNEIVFPKYLTYWFKFYPPSRLIENDAYPSIKTSTIQALKINLPPLSEQKRIAQILDKADELRQKRQQSIEKLDELLQATFIDMFGDPVTNPNKHKTDILANYVLKDFQNGLYKPASFYGSGTPILRIDGYRNGDIINESNFKRLELEPSEIEKYKLTKMDLVINRVNSPEYLGKIALFMDDREDTVFESNMMRFSIRQELLNVYYLIFLFKQRYISNQIATKRKDAVNQSSINQQDVKSLILNVPNIKLQNKWAELYQSCNMQKKILTSQLNQQETLFQSLQQRAFNGEL